MASQTTIGNEIDPAGGDGSENKTPIHILPPFFPAQRADRAKQLRDQARAWNDSTRCTDRGGSDARWLTGVVAPVARALATAAKARADPNAAGDLLRHSQRR